MCLRFISGVLLLAVAINANTEPKDSTWLEISNESILSAAEKLDIYYPGRIYADDCVKQLKITARVRVTTPHATVGAVEFIADLMRLDVVYSEDGNITLLPRQGIHECPPVESGNN